MSTGQVSLLEYDKIKEVLDKHEAVFVESIGCLEDVKVTLQVNEAGKPRFLSPEPSLSYFMREN